MRGSGPPLAPGLHLPPLFPCFAPLPLCLFPPYQPLRQQQCKLSPGPLLASTDVNCYFLSPGLLHPKHTAEWDRDGQDVCRAKLRLKDIRQIEREMDRMDIELP